MLTAVLVIAAIVCAYCALRARRLIPAALWLAGVSALVSILLYRLGAYEAAVIELSVGAGLVTILFVFAISVAGDEGMTQHTEVPRLLVGGVLLFVVALLGWMVWPFAGLAQPVDEPGFTAVLWQERGLDVVLQIGLIFGAVMAILGLLSDLPRGELRQTAVNGHITAATPKDLQLEIPDPEPETRDLEPEEVTS